MPTWRLSHAVDDPEDEEGVKLIERDEDIFLPSAEAAIGYGKETYGDMLIRVQQLGGAVVWENEAETAEPVEDKVAEETPEQPPEETPPALCTIHEVPLNDDSTCPTCVEEVAASEAEVEARHAKDKAASEAAAKKKAPKKKPKKRSRKKSTKKGK